MALRFVIGVFFLFASLACLGQSSQDGFIIVDNGQYKYGEVVVEPGQESTQCSFRESISQPFKIFKPEDIEGYGIIDGVQFFTRPIENNNEPKKYFVKVEHLGLVKQFTYEGRIFIEAPKWIELKADGDYKSELRKIVGSCQNIGRSIQQLTFTTEGVRSLLEKYEVCANNGFQLDRKISLFIECTAGLEVSFFNMKSPIANMAFVNQDRLRDLTLFTTDIRFGMKLLKRPVAFLSGLKFGSQRLDLTTTTGPNPSKSDKISYTFQEALIPLRVRFYRATSEGTFQSFFTIGMAFPLQRNPQMTWNHEVESADRVVIDRYDLKPVVKPGLQAELAFGSSLSITRKLTGVAEINFSVNHDKIANALVNKNLELYSKRVQILFGIRF